MTLAQILFKNRSYTPIPFVIVMLIFAKPTPVSLIVGFAIAALGEFTRAWGVFYAGSETRVTGSVGASRLVTSGPFGYVRNPLYVGNIMMYVGIGIMSMALFPYLQIFALLYFVFQYTMIVSEEERFLREEFGEEYKLYCAGVRRFFPRFTPYSSPHPMTINWDAGWKSERRSLQAFAFVSLLLVAIYFFL